MAKQGTAGEPVRPGDRFGCLDELAYELTREELRAFTQGEQGEMPLDARRAAYWVAVALGRCRLCGVDVPDDMKGIFSTEMAFAAAQELTKFARDWQAEAVLLPRRFSESDPLEGEDLCVSMVYRRLRAWAAFVAIEDAYTVAIERHDVRADPLLAAMGGLLNAMTALDDALEKQVDLLSLAAGTRLLENWGHMLAPEFREPLPWLLDGTLEAAAKQVSTQVEQAAAGPELWKAAIRRGRVVAEPEAIPQGEPALASKEDGEPPWEKAVRWVRGRLEELDEAIAATAAAPQPVPVHLGADDVPRPPITVKLILLSRAFDASSLAQSLPWAGGAVSITQSKIDKATATAEYTASAKVTKHKPEFGRGALRIVLESGGQVGEVLLSRRKASGKFLSKEGKPARLSADWAQIAEPSLAVVPAEGDK